MQRYLYAGGLALLVMFSGCTPSVLQTGKSLKNARSVVADGKVNMKDRDGDTALHFAASEGNIDVTKYLLEHGANIEAVNKWGNTPFLAAVIGRKLETTRYLLEKGADFQVANQWGITPLISASSRGELEIVKLLLAKGANIEAKSEDGDTALMWASRRGHLETVKYLVAKGADKSAINNKKKSAYVIAQENKRQDIMDVTATVGKSSAEEAVKLAFAKAKAEDTISAYEHFQAFYPNSDEYTKEAASLAEKKRLALKGDEDERRKKLQKIQELVNKGDLEGILKYTDSLR